MGSDECDDDGERTDDVDGGECSDEAYPAELGRSERATAHAVVQIDDAERLAAGDQRHREHAAELQRVNALVHFGQLAGGVDRHDRIGRRERALGERAAQRELDAVQIVAGDVARRPGHELAPRCAQKEQAALDAGPEHEGKVT